MFTSILLFPFIYFLFLLLCNEIKPRSGLKVGLYGYFLTIIISVCLLLKSCILKGTSKYVFVYHILNWSTLGGVDLNFFIFFDFMSIIMTFTVLFIAFCVNMFSVYYMSNDPFIIRFFAYLSLFTFCMLLLVTAMDLLQFFIGWELVGMCSYILINFWYTRKQANIAAMKAVMVNRFGDYCFLLGMGLLIFKYQTLNILELSYLVLLDDCSNFNLNAAAILLFLAVMSKSAQFGLHMWLPDAMEGPTPVSALIHAATMVTAGIFLLLRLSNIFELCSFISNIIVLVGTLTALFGATTGIAQSDIKKIIAFSTCSQLGYMVAACGLSCYNIAFFHLITHAFFKSLLFLCAGNVIHTLSGEQDIRKMGGLLKILPFTFVCICIASWALCGIPYFAGYYSKEMIISVALQSDLWLFNFSGIVLLIAAVFTSFYSAKLVYYVFISKSNVSVKPHSENSELFFIFQYLPLTLLSMMSIVSGYLLKDPITGYGLQSSLNYFYEYSIDTTKVSWHEFLNSTIKLVITFISMSGYIFYFFVYKNYINLDIIFEKNKLVRNLYNFFYNRWFLDATVSTIFSHFFLFFYEDFNSDIIQIKFIDYLSTKTVIAWSENSQAHYGNAIIYTPFQYVRAVISTSLLLLFVTTYIGDLYDYYHLENYYI